MNYWKDKNVLVTGASGFIGSSVAKELVERGAKVVTIIRDIKNQNSIDALGIKDKITILIGNLIDLETVERSMNEYEIDTCFHIAAQAIVGSANRAPLSTFESNIKGTWNILETCRLSKTIKRAIIASSDKAYGQQKILPYTEESPLLGYYPYDASKACADLLSTSYFKAYQVPLAIARNANTYGPADLNFNRIIPETIKSIIEGKQPVIRSDGTPERDYIFIKDSVNAYLTLAENVHRPDVVGQAFNFGSGTPINVIELYNKIIKLMGKDIKPKILGEGKNEIDRQFLDSSKANKILNWNPKFNLDEGLKNTIEWYKEHF